MRIRCHNDCSVFVLTAVGHPCVLIKCFPILQLLNTPGILSAQNPDLKNKKVKPNGKCLESPETSTSDLTQTGSQCSSKGVLLKDPGEDMYVSRKKALARQTCLHSPVKVLDR